VTPGEAGSAPTPRPGGSGDLQRALTPGQARRLGHWTRKRHKSLKRAWEGLCSPRQAIKLQCLECVGEDVPSITTCTAECCPLWHFRPYQHKAGGRTAA